MELPRSSQNRACVGHPASVSPLRQAIENTAGDNIIDGCTEGKDREPLVWFIEEVNQRMETSISVDFVF